MAAAVIELDALANAIRTAAQDHDLLAVHRRGFTCGFISGIEVRREALEFGGARVYAVEDGADSQFLAPRAHGQLAHLPCPGNLCVRDAVALGGFKLLARDSGGRNALQPALELDHLADLLE